MECITCALCIDACDDVMAKIGKPRGLIDYLALSDEPTERTGRPPRPAWKHVVRPRTIMYTVLWAGIGLGLLVALFIRTEIGINVSPVRNPTYVTLSDGSIRNTYDIRLLNKLGFERPFQLSLTAEAPLQITLEGVEGQIVTVPADETFQQRVYVTAPAGTPAATSDRTELRFWVEDLENDARASATSVFNGRKQ
jgi:polyferredoxin